MRQFFYALKTKFPRAFGYFWRFGSQQQGSRMKDYHPIGGPALKKPLPAKPRFFPSMLNWSERSAV